MSAWKRDVVSGLVVVVPILVTLYAVTWVYGQISSVPLLNQTFAENNVPNAVRVLLLLVIFAVIVLSVGYSMRTAIGTYFENLIDDAANRMPGIRVIYNASKMAIETALTGATDLQTPVKFEPWDGMRMTAFKTGKRTEDGREIIFLPTAPNITSGYVIEVRPEDIEEVDEAVEDALTRILSAGFGESQDARAFNIDVVADEGGDGSGEGSDSGSGQPSPQPGDS